MKNNFYLNGIVLITFLMLSPARSQFLDEVHFFGGLTCSSLSGDNAESFTQRWTFQAGVEKPFQLNDQFYFVPGLTYSQQGSAYEEVGLSGNYNLAYVNAPLCFEYRLNNKISLRAGPQVGVLVSAVDEFESSGFSGEEDVTDITKGLDYGGVVGIVYRFASIWTARATYYSGFNNIYVGDVTNTEWRNQVANVSIGVDLEGIFKGIGQNAASAN